MAKFSDTSPEAERLMEEQAQRLKRFRELLGLSANDAAEMANVTRFVWYRMEAGTARIDAVALGRLGQAKDLPVEYVISGSLTGLPSKLVRDLVAREIAERVRSFADTPPAPGRSRRGKHAKPDNRNSDTSHSERTEPLVECA